MSMCSTWKEGEPCVLIRPRPAAPGTCSTHGVRGAAPAHWSPLPSDSDPAAVPGPEHMARIHLRLGIRDLELVFHARLADVKETARKSGNHACVARINATEHVVAMLRSSQKATRGANPPFIISPHHISHPQAARGPTLDASTLATPSDAAPARGTPRDASTLATPSDVAPAHGPGCVASVFATPSAPATACVAPQLTCTTHAAGVGPRALGASLLPTFTPTSGGRGPGL